MDLETEILNMDEAAAYLRISRRHLGNILRGKVKNVPPIPCVQAGRRTLIKRTDLDHWFSEACKQHFNGIVLPMRWRRRLGRRSEPLQMTNVGRIEAPRNPGCASGECS